MNYSELVDSYIKKSGLSLAEIAKRMQTEKGIKVDRSYISKLRNDPKYPATEEINRALAEITGGDPEALVKLGYYEKAPEEIKKSLEKADIYDKLIDFLVSTKPISVEFVPAADQLMSEDELLTEQQKEQEFMNSPEFLFSLPIDVRSEFISDLLKVMAEKYPEEYRDLVSQKNKGNEHFYTIEENNSLECSQVAESSGTYTTDAMHRIPTFKSLKSASSNNDYNIDFTFVDRDLLQGREGFALYVNEDSMSGDRIMGGDLVVVAKQNEARPNDITAVAVKNQEIILRRVKLHGDMMVLVPSNTEYEPLLVPAKDVRIIGKVVEVKFWPK
ncbi:Peptidase S24-like [Paenibacillus tianmuensis]|uniref:Peptidase S24-like n=1 Tax=Paenibacillus tianmuensis TaxID=624147 RepID=A0A1G4Q6D1_9BACL|nr:S24 family peptidase [Paenibacillus tianmuensis]SCW40174.1 Peptidase S24-like [Paenibacillus tianmuensis]